jgi:hypothetical protein
MPIVLAAIISLVPLALLAASLTRLALAKGSPEPTRASL